MYLKPHFLSSCLPTGHAITKLSLVKMYNHKEDMLHVYSTVQTVIDFFIQHTYELCTANHSDLSKSKKLDNLFLKGSEKLKFVSTSCKVFFIYKASKCKLFH